MVHDLGLAVDNLRPLPLPVRGQLTPWPVHEHGLIANVIVGLDRTRMRTVRGHGQIESMSGTEPDHDRGYAAFAAMSNPNYEAIPCPLRDRFADKKTCLPAGVGLALT